MADINKSVNVQEKENVTDIYYSNQKVNAQPYQDVEINLLNIFVHMKNAKWIFLWLMAVCIALGAFVPYMWGLINAHTESVQALISFEYSNAGKMQTPDGRALDVNQITSSNIVATAIKKSGMEEVLSTGAVSNNISISRMLTADSRQKKEILEKLSEANSNVDDPSEYINNLKDAASYSYKNQYIIELKNGFGSNGNLIYLTGDDLATLINNIVSEYKNYFFETYGDFTFPDNKIDDISIEELDYIEWLDNMVNILDSLSAYCNSMANSNFANYCSAKNGFSFGDINKIIKIIKNTKVDYLYSYVYYNCLAKDKDSVITKFDYSLKNLKYNLDIVNENITNGEKLIGSYKINSILINRQAGVAGEDAVIRSSSVTDYYNNLVLQQADYYGQKATLQVAADNLNDKIKGFSGSSSNAQKIAIAEKEINDVNILCRQLYALVNGLAEEIAGSETFAGSYITSVDASYNDSFFTKNIKKVAIGVTIGLVVAGLAWCVYGFVKEMVNNSGKDRE